jgi:hypothetical protein
MVVLTAPTGGWAAQLDHTRRQLGGMDVFITARRPNPAFLHTQALVEHRIATSVPTTDNASLYLRIVEFNQEPESVPYRQAAEVPARATSSMPRR